MASLLSLTRNTLLNLSLTDRLVVIVLPLCAVLLIGAVVLNFVLARSQNSPQRERLSIVATATMSLFATCFYGLIATGVGSVHATVPSLVLVGLLLVVVGTATNLAGRYYLAQNWSDHIRIYTDHRLITEGPYRLVRHPLYASLVWMFVGVSLVFYNLVALAATLLVFLPFMYYRAAQEEGLLREKFSRDYPTYQEHTGMFFPRLLPRNQTTV